ncbi:MAG: LLM class flavin-dependent oxidoreductase [Actinomycetaceae bacterium]|nr:LLM class flavin-dependent oxidoreductase [Actinomycetaceae bacterium]
MTTQPPIDSECTDQSTKDASRHTRDNTVTPTDPHVTIEDMPIHPSERKNRQHTHNTNVTPIGRKSGATSLPQTSEQSLPSSRPVVVAATQKSGSNTSSSKNLRVPLSILDLSPKSEGSSRKDALDASLELAKVADRNGYARYWMAEHHGSMAFMSSATALLLARAAEHTERVRIGAGGVMLPNHTPLMVAEYYGTLATLYGDRIDLGLGRAPGTDPITASTLRRGSAELDDFSRDVTELKSYLADFSEDEAPPTLSGAEAAVLGIPYRPQVQRRHVRAIPGEGTKVPLWMLSSSAAGAHVAAELGMPYSFASHFAPSAMEKALQTYRDNYQGDSPWALRKEPYVMAGVQVMVAPTREEAEYLASSGRQLRSDIRRGVPSELKPPQKDMHDTRPDLRLVDASGSPSFEIVGTPQDVVAGLEALVNFWEMDELIVITWAYDPKMRERSYELLAQAWNG